MHATGSPTGSWVFKKTLGMGSFGEVTLYEHKGTKAFIAVKKCKVALHNEMMRRWKDEVEFMESLQHPNIVKGLPVPKELEATPPELPRLGMEYCSKGDLRKKLSEPAHVCGFPEAEVLLLAKHISSAMEYLHSKDIIHRDIKPENIMIQEQDRKNVYKLTDLGFAKDSKHQPATSFVGTKEYMAPELYTHTEYTKTADYWSFGTVISELITGSRPFMLSGLPVVQWHTIIGSKTQKDIGFYESHKGVKAYAQQLPQPNQLSRPMRESFEAWLGLMLQADPQQRGGVVKDSRSVCFRWLDVILQCKIVHVRCMIDGRLWSYPVKPRDTVTDLHKTLSKQTGLPTDHHLIILPDGRLLGDGAEILHDYLTNPHGENVVYMFQRELVPQVDKFFVPPRTDLVTALMQDNHKQVSENGFKVMWKQALHNCHRLMHDGKEMVAGFTAFLNYNHALNTQLKEATKEMLNGVQRLRAKSEFFQESLQADLSKYTHQAATGFHSPNLYDKWTGTRDDVQHIATEPEETAEEIERRVKEMHQRIFELHKTAGKHRHVESLNETKRKSDEIFLRFKEENKVNRREAINCKPIQDQVNRAHEDFLALNRDIFTQLKEVQSCCQAVEGLLTRIQRCDDNTQAVGRRIMELQKERQVMLWEVIQRTISKSKEDEKKAQRSLSRATSLVTPTASPLTAQPPSFDTQQLIAPDQLDMATMDPSSIITQSMQAQNHFDTSFDEAHVHIHESLQAVETLVWEHLDDET